jgi:hypothetical protein
MDQNDFYKFEMDNLVNELLSQINSNRQIYERFKEEDFDKKIHENIKSVRENLKQQIKTHQQYLLGIETGNVNFSAQVEEPPKDLKKDQLILKLIEIDKKVIGSFRSTDILQKLFTVPWRTEQVKAHEIVRSMLLHESYFIGRNSILVDFMGLSSLKNASDNWASEQQK